MSPCVYHMSSLTNAITLPVPSKVVTQAVLFENEKVRDYLGYKTSGGCLISCLP